MRFRSIFITGTDTGVGKTTIACGLAALLRRAHAVGVFKPAETGCAAAADGELRAEDATRLLYFAEAQAERRAVCPYTLPEPLAPQLAARRAGVVICVNEIRRAYERIADAHDVTLIEGAGGLLVPLGPGVTFADLAAALDADVLVVVGSRLGAINHALLTMRQARHAGLRLLGYVMNTLSDTPDLAATTNADVLMEWLGPPLGSIPYLGSVEMTPAERTRLAQIFAASVNPGALLSPA